MQFIGFLGGTFDPIHNGHIHLAIEVQKKLKLDEIKLIPANPTFKEETYYDKDIEVQGELKGIIRKYN